MSRQEVIDLLSALVAIESINPSLVPGDPSAARGEEEISRYVVDWLRAAGLEASQQEVAPRRSNAIAILRGRGGGKSLMLNAHTDTVGVAGMDDPFTPRIEGDQLHGRGAYDMKGGLAAIMLAVWELSRAGQLAGDIIVTAVADEEYASLGTQAVLKGISAEAAIVTEPTALEVCIAHKGFAWIEVETMGRAAHGSRPDLGVDAISAMGHVLIGFDELNRALAVREGHPLLGSASVHASLIRGGQELSSYPAACIAQFERRTLPGETPEKVATEVRAVLEQVQNFDPRSRALGNVFFWRDAFAIEPEADIVAALSAAASDVTGQAPNIVGQTPWMDAAFLQAAGIPTAVYGPGGGGAHAVEEWVSVSQVATCADVLVRLARTFCGPAG